MTSAQFTPSRVLVVPEPPPLEGHAPRALPGKLAKLPVLP